MTDPHYLHPAVASDPTYRRFRGLCPTMTDEAAWELTERAAMILSDGGVEAHVLARLEGEWLLANPRKATR